MGCGGWQYHTGRVKQSGWIGASSPSPESFGIHCNRGCAGMHTSSLTLARTNGQNSNIQDLHHHYSDPACSFTPYPRHRLRVSFVGTSSPVCCVFSRVLRKLCCDLEFPLTLRSTCSSSIDDCSQSPCIRPLSPRSAAGEHGTSGLIATSLVYRRFRSNVPLICIDSNYSEIRQPPGPLASNLNQDYIV